MIWNDVYIDSWDASNSHIAPFPRVCNTTVMYDWYKTGMAKSGAAVIKCGTVEPNCSQRGGTQLNEKRKGVIIIKMIRW